MPTDTPTLKSIASSLGLSTATVSRALAGDTRIAPGTRERVQAEARAVNYRGSVAARRLRTGRSMVITVVVDFPPRVHGTYLSFTYDMVLGLQTSLAPRGYQLTITPNFSGDLLTTIRQIVDEGLADGLVFSRTVPDDPRIHFLCEAKFPFVSHGRSCASQTWSWVDFDIEAFGAESVHVLAGLGARRLIYLRPTENLAFGLRIENGIRAAARSSGIEIEVVDDETGAHAVPTQGAQLAERLGSGPLTGVIASNELTAMQLHSAAAAVGLRAGRDYFMAAKTTSRQLDFLPAGCIAFLEDPVAEGVEIGRMLLDQLSGSAADPQTRIFPLTGWHRVDPST